MKKAILFLIILLTFTSCTETSKNSLEIPPFLKNSVQ